MKAAEGLSIGNNTVVRAAWCRRVPEEKIDYALHGESLHCMVKDTGLTRRKSIPETFDSNNKVEALILF